LAFYTYSISVELGHNFDISDVFSWLLPHLNKNQNTLARHFMAILPAIDWICFNLNLHIKEVYLKKVISPSVLLF